MRNIRPFAYAIAAVIAAMIAACGNKGDLVKPTPPATQQPPSPDAPAAPQDPAGH